MAVRRPRLLIAMIGDMVHSTALSSSNRAAAQRDFARLIASLNRRFRGSIASQFVITLGDEFQGLLSKPEAIPDIVWIIETEYRQRDMRLGFGFGTLHTPLRQIALNIDGPALHRARDAVTIARTKGLLGGVFDGFGTHDDVLTGFAQILRHVRYRMTPRQRTVLNLLRDGHTQTQVARKLGVSKQAVSASAIAAGWDAYRIAEQGWRIALSLAVHLSKEGAQ